MIEVRHEKRKPTAATDTSSTQSAIDSHTATCTCDDRCCCPSALRLRRPFRSPLGMRTLPSVAPLPPSPPPLSLPFSLPILLSLESSSMPSMGDIGLRWAGRAIRELLEAPSLHSRRPIPVAVYGPNESCEGRMGPGEGSGTGRGFRLGFWLGFGFVSEDLAARCGCAMSVTRTPSCGESPGRSSVPSDGVDTSDTRSFGLCFT